MDPFETEWAFQELRAALAGPTSPRWRLMALARFLDRIDRDDPATGAYLLELAQRLRALTRRLDPAGLDPAACRRLLHRLERARACHHELEATDDFAAALEHLRQATALLYGYVGEVARTIAMATSTSLEDVPSWLREAEDASDRLAPLERLERTVAQAQATGHPAAEVLARLASIWREQRAATQDEAFIPVVERPLLEDNPDVHLGSLRRVRVEVYGERAGADDLAANVALLDEGDVLPDASLSAPAQAARALLAETHASVAERYVAARVRFEEAGRMHAGRSSDLAVAALFYGAVLRHLEQRRRYAVAPGVALTGRLDDAGTVLPVDALEVKVRAAFFSAATALAVPKAQEAEALLIRDTLATAYPRRRLDVVGAGHLREVFYDRRLTRHRQTGRAAHLARRAWKRKFSLGGLAVILLLLLALGRLVYGPLDRNPVAAEVAEEVLLIKNKRGAVLGELEIGERTAEMLPGNDHPGLVAFIDVDGDGINEVIWGENADRETRHRSFIHCTSLRADSFLWSVPLRYRFRLPNQPGLTGEEFDVEQLLAGDVDGDGRPEVIANVRYPHLFLRLILKLEAATGRERGRYVHIGTGIMDAVDLDGDGITEILLGGTNNAFDEATLAVLDPRFLTGHSPLTEAYRVAGVPPGQERAYLRIPKTRVGKALGYNAGSNLVRRIAVRPESKLLTLRIMDAHPLHPRLDVPAMAQIFLTLNFDLEPVGVETGTDYDRMAAMLRDQGLLERLPDVDYFDAYKDGILYWDGAGWQDTTAVNRRYLEALAQENPGRAGAPAP